VNATLPVTCTHCGSSNVQVAARISDDLIGRCQHCWETFSLGVAMLTGYVVDGDGDVCAACERYVLQPWTIHDGPR
jgi:hypothetical protein